MSKELQDFYIAIHQWLITAAWGSRVNPYSFTETAGLCTNLQRFAKNSGIDIGQCAVLCSEMSESFTNAGLNRGYPFNKTGIDYGWEFNKFRNPARLKWIKDHLPKEPE